MKKRIALNFRFFVLIGLMFLIPGCEKQEALDQFLIDFMDEDRVQSLIIPSRYGEASVFKVDLQEKVQAEDVLTAACESAELEEDLAVYQKELESMKDRYEELISTLKLEKIEKPMNEADRLVVLESKEGADIKTLSVDEDLVLRIEDQDEKSYYRIEEKQAEELVRIYEQFYDYYTSDDCPCWAREWRELMKE